MVLIWRAELQVYGDEWHLMGYPIRCLIAWLGNGVPARSTRSYRIRLQCNMAKSCAAIGSPTMQAARGFESQNRPRPSIAGAAVRRQRLPVPTDDFDGGFLELATRQAFEAGRGLFQARELAQLGGGQPPDAPGRAADATRWLGIGLLLLPPRNDWSGPRGVLTFGALYFRLLVFPGGRWRLGALQGLHQGEPASRRCRLVGGRVGRHRLGGHAFDAHSRPERTGGILCQGVLLTRMTASGPIRSHHMQPWQAMAP